MSATTLPDVQLDENGRVNLAVLESSINSESALNWMRARFAERDTFPPLDRDSLETPDALFNDIWNRAGSGHPKLTNVLTEALTSLLHEGWSRRRAEQLPGLRHALRLASVRPLPPARALFREVIQDAPSFVEKADSIDLLWVEAAAAQPLGSDVQEWRRLLEIPRYASAAYSALEQDYGLALANLPTFWQVLPAQDRRIVLRQALSRLLSAHGDKILPELLRQPSSADWTNELKSEVNDVFRAFGRPEPFVHPLGHGSEPDAFERVAALAAHGTADLTPSDEWKLIWSRATGVYGASSTAPADRAALLQTYPVDERHARALLMRAKQEDAVLLQNGYEVAALLKFAPTVEPWFTRGFTLEVRSEELVPALEAALTKSPPAPPSRGSPVPPKPRTTPPIATGPIG